MRIVLMAGLLSALLAATGCTPQQRDQLAKTAKDVVDSPFGRAAASLALDKLEAELTKKVGEPRNDGERRALEEVKKQIAILRDYASGKIDSKVAAQRAHAQAQAFISEILLLR